MVQRDETIFLVGPVVVLESYTTIMRFQIEHERAQQYQTEVE